MGPFFAGNPKNERGSLSETITQDDGDLEEKMSQNNKITRFKKVQTLK